MSVARSAVRAIDRGHAARRAEMGGPPLPAKLTPPDTGAAIDRARLFRVLDRASSSIAWLHAPAGGGKTTLLASYLAARDVPSVWYHVDAGDTDAELIHYVRLAAERLTGEASKLPRALPGASPEARRGAARHFFESVAALLPAGTCLVFDDYQRAAESPEWNETFAALAAAAASAGRSIRILVTSRVAPPASLARLCGTGELAVLDWSALRLDEREVRRLLDGAQRADLDSAELAALTGGWAIAVSLLSRADASSLAPLAKPVARSLSGAPARRAPETDERLFRYLAAEVLERLDVPCRELLSAIATMPSFSTRMAAAVMRRDDVEALLSRLHEEHLLIEGQGEDAYRIHDLLRAFLVRRARAEASDLEWRAHVTRVARLLAEDDQHKAAIELLHDAQAWDALADLIEAHAPRLALSGRIPAIGDALDHLPAEHRGSRPWLVLWDALATVGKPGVRALELAEHAFASLRASGQGLGALFAWSIAVQAAVVAGEDYGRFPAWLDALAELAPLVPLAPPPIALSVARAEVLAHAFGELGTARSIEAAERALEVMRVHGELDDLLEVSAGALLVFYMGGQHERAEDMRRFARERFERAGDNARPKLAYLHSHALLELASARFESGRRAVDEALDIARATGVELWNASLSMVGVMCRVGEGDHEGADRMLDVMGVAAASGARFAREQYAYGRAWALLERGDTEGARRWLGHARTENARLRFRFSDVQEHLLAVVIEGTSGARNAFEEAVSQLERVVRETDCEWLSVSAALVTVHGRLCLGEDVTDSLRDAFGRLRQLGPARPGYLVPTATRRLATAALERGVEPELARSLLLAYGAPLPAGSEPAPSPVRIRTLGPLQVEIDGAPLTFGRKSPVTLISLLHLLASSTEPLPAARLTSLLWPAHGAMAARGVLDTALYRLRKLLGHEGAIETTRGLVALAEAVCWVDVRAFALECDRLGELARDGRVDRDSLERHEAALFELYRGPFAPGDDRPPITRARERLRARFTRACTLLAAAWRQLGETERAAHVERLAAARDGGERSGVVLELRANR